MIQAQDQLAFSFFPQDHQMATGHSFHGSHMEEMSLCRKKCSFLTVLVNDSSVMQIGSHWLKDSPLNQSPWKRGQGMPMSSANQGSPLKALGSDPREFHDGRETGLHVTDK